MAFWTVARLARTRKAVRSYNAAITRAAKANGSYEGLPLKLTVAEVKEMVGEDAAAYRRIVGNERDRMKTTLAGKPKKARPSYLDRVLKGVNPRALEINPRTGNSFFVDKENRYQYRRDVKRAKRARDIYSDKGGLAPKPLQGTRTHMRQAIMTYPSITLITMSCPHRRNLWQR